MEDLLNKQSPIVADLIRKIEDSRKEDVTKQLDYACDLFDLAQERGNEDLQDYASCALGDACCQNTDYSQALYYLGAGINGLAKTDEYELICRCYNEMGIILRNEGHYITAEGYFINSIDTARANRLYRNEVVACSNFASLCEEMGADDAALEYHYRAIECLGFIEDSLDKYDLMIGDYAFIIRVYIRLDNRTEADRAFQEMMHILDMYPELDQYFDVMLSKYDYYKWIGDSVNADLYRHKCLNEFYACEEYFIYFDEMKDLIKIILEEADYPEVEKMITHVESKFRDDEMNSLRIYIEKYKVELYETMGNRQKMMESAYNYYKLEERKVKDNRRSFLTTLKLRVELVQQRTRNLFLSAAAETDALTGLSNRMKLNTIIDELFIMANEEQLNLGVEMMDVDYFKQVNDTYGHSKGDELLVEIGKMLKSIVNDRIFVARYGGDEFIIYYYNMTDEEILEVVKYIHSGVREIGKSLGIGTVSSSQGVVNHIPRPGNKAWDYMNAADLALYYVKNNGKNNARLIHKTSDVDECPWEKIF